MNKRLSFSEFVECLVKIENASNKTIQENGTLEDFLTNIINEGLIIEEVVTGDIAQVTKPLMTLKRKSVYENSPLTKEAEEFINKYKHIFKKTYGKEWEQILYAVANKL